MAADWVKIRSDLYRDPKVSVIADALMEPDGLLAGYVSQMCQRDMTVTRNVMRNVTVGALASVWGVMRQRGKRNEDSLLCVGVGIGVIDDIADLPGFGAAMQEAGWVVETEEGIEFPRFFDEYNTDPAEALKQRNAERQRRFREKRATENSNVTRNVTVTPREEKRREEKSNTKNKQKELAEEFSKWYSVYPRRTAKGAAYAAYCKAVKRIATEHGIDLASAVDRLQAWTLERVPQIESHEMQFRKQPATWLNQECYSDEFTLQVSRVATLEHLDAWSPK